MCDRLQCFLLTTLLEDPLEYFQQAYGRYDQSIEILDRRRESLAVKFLKERPQVARKVVEVIDEATKLANADFEKYKPIIPKYTPMRAEQLDLLAKPYLRGFGDLNDTDLNSYQALVDVFQKEGVLQSPIAVRDKILKTTDFGS